MVREELYELSKKCLSPEGQNFVKGLIADHQILAARSVLLGGFFAKGKTVAPEDVPAVEKLLRFHDFHLEDLV